MRVLRVIGAAFLVLLGSMLIVAWSVAGRTVESIESGTAATNLTQKLLNDPGFAEAAAQRATDRLVERTEGRFIGRVVVAFEPEIQQIIVRVLQSDQVDAAVTESVSRLEDKLTQELTAADRPSAPFVISIDLSDRVNARIDEIPVVGMFIPDVTVPPIERELIDAATFDQVRQVYGAIKLVASWGLFVGVVLVVAGFFVAPRTRWYWPGALLAVGFIVLAVSIAVRRVIPAQIAGAVPGGEEGGAGTFLSEFVSENTTGPIATRLALLAFWALVLAIGFGLIARMLPGWKERLVASQAPANAVVATGAAHETFVAPDGIPAEVGVVAESVVVEEPEVTEQAAVIADDAVLEEVVEDAPEAVPAAPPAKKAPAKKATTARSTAKTSAPAKTTAAKSTPAKTTKATPASAAPKPRTSRAKKPPTTPAE